MIKRMAACLATLLFLSVFAKAEIEDPIEWKFKVVMVGTNEADLIIEAKIEDKWHLYSQNLPSDDGPVATYFSFEENPNFERVGKVKESESITEFDKVNGMDLTFFAKKAVFTQRIKILGKKPFNVKGFVEFMVCDDEKCLPPDMLDFEFPKVVPKVAEVADVIEDTNTEGNELIISNEPEVYDPVTWTHKLIKVNKNEFELIITASLEEGWHLYSQHLKNEDGPIATNFHFDTHGGIILDGGVKEKGELYTEYDPNFMMDLSFYKDQVSFSQSFRASDETKPITGFLEFMVCNDKVCLPPDKLDINIDLKTGEGIIGLVEDSGDSKTDIGKIIPFLPGVNLNDPLGNCGERFEISNIWVVFLMGLIGGLIALLTPCVFPMIPLTVSFFTKGKTDTKGGLMKASLYGLFILLIYSSLSIPFHFNTDPEILSEVATSVWLNIIFFIVFVVFAISFFGYFEITLPSTMANKVDSASNVGGIIGIFFMALTLALVSFSCTGPILGTVLGNSLKDGPWPISAAMSGFGLALGLPFAFFAAFPGIMNKLPKSGGWLNSVKVVLGFIELALALKFLSNADLVEQWGFIKRETFFLIWAALALGLAAYLVGWIRFPHDSPIKKFSKTRIFLVAASFSFAIYIMPGVLKNPPWSHNLLSGFPPPMFYSWYEKETFHSEFMDFDEAFAEAKRVNKPLLIDFTGWACVNCRKMEESVWTVENIKRKLREDFVLVSLYVDDKVELPKQLQGVFEYEINGKLKKKRIRTIGNKWATFQTHTFNNNSQPYYVMLNTEGELLGNPVGYTPDENDYNDYLECGLAAFRSNLGAN